MSSIWMVPPDGRRRWKVAVTTPERFATNSRIRDEAAAVPPSTARNALVRAIWILSSSYTTTAPLRLMTRSCPGAVAAMAGDSSRGGLRTASAAAVVSVIPDPVSDSMGCPQRPLLAGILSMRTVSHEKTMAPTDERNDGFPPARPPSPPTTPKLGGIPISAPRHAADAAPPIEGSPPRPRSLPKMPETQDMGLWRHLNPNILRFGVHYKRASRA